MKYVDIAGIKYTIELTKNLARDRNSSGECNLNQNCIYIEESISNDLKDKVLLHEIIEAINFEYSLNLSHNNIVILESALYQVFKHNKFNFNGNILKELVEL